MIDFVAIPRERMDEIDKLKKKLEKLTDVKIEVSRSEENTIKIEDEDSLNVMRCSQVVHAFGRGFEVEDALNLLDDDYKLEIVGLQEYAGKSKQRLVTLRGRLIGTKGKTRAAIEEAAGVKLAVYGKTVGIIGRWDRVNVARQAVEMILRGCKHNSVYRFLEEQKIK
jgi:ribosomal RNA assembly protein